ncbi:MAG: BON domain-containing protein [Comamonas sp.]|jgi:osmotically-inducible protein OsmY|uniref:BON domain-containing protein n=1 Tax=Comamonas sp. TaxID=34028 RepID=UPI002834CBA4|nr:BON domain-containing protein [Comamonas sp.]MDR0214268.1 BON domain-containing protein [Comamonas sp.]MDR2298248.1 BON domain-containing protein [Comamonas sp.]
MKLQWTRTACAVLTVAALGGALSGCIALVGGGAAVAGMSAVDRRTTGTQVEDQGIELRAGNRIAEVMGDKARVSVTSYNRVVLLTGQAGNATDQAAIEKLVREQSTVRNVYNEIEVAPFTATLGQRSKDTMITGQVKASLVNAKDISSSAIKVVTENNVVYLMGIVTPRESKRAAEIARGVNDVAKVVRLFEVISEDELSNMSPQPAPVVEDRSSMN